MSEGGQVEVCAVLTSGTLEKDVIVLVSSSNGTANGTQYTCMQTTHQISFSD